jgi:DnaJ-domain-containing protein 1
MDRDRTLAREDEAAKLAELRAADVAANLVNQEKQERLKEERERVARDREASAKSAMQERLERERLDKERLEKERLEVERNAIPVGIDPKRPVRPKVERSEDGGGGFLSFWWGRKRTTVQTNTLYTVLGCSSGASRAELKRSYLSLAKETHPDALLQIGIVNDDKTERRFTEIAQAWKVLGDPTSRRRYDRELQAKGISSTAGNIFEALVMGAAQALDEVLAVAEESLDNK